MAPSPATSTPPPAIWVHFIVANMAQDVDLISNQFGWVLLNVHRNRRLVRDGSPEWPPRLSHSSWALFLTNQPWTYIYTGPCSQPNGRSYTYWSLIFSFKSLLQFVPNMSARHPRTLRPTSSSSSSSSSASQMHHAGLLDAFEPFQDRCDSLCVSHAVTQDARHKIFVLNIVQARGLFRGVGLFMHHHCLITHPHINDTTLLPKTSTPIIIFIFYFFNVQQQSKSEDGWWWRKRKNVKINKW